MIVVNKYDNDNQCIVVGKLTNRYGQLTKHKLTKLNTFLVEGIFTDFLSRVYTPYILHNQTVFANDSLDM